ncbi:otefin [Stomoxys calcitrans]|uniref:otefin n=1 Tax=Stomoxys calcitrans TaxID=35570 RepID=UPI0027E38EB7|nr:otefin [Stomoxys calcitrans]
MAALESLSNKELRQKCIEYGMPNVPVTDSSRKILIRRLEAAMSGKPATPNKTNRRETMHVSKPSQMASSAKIDNAAVNINNNTTAASKPTAANRPSRRTIAATTERHVTTTTTVSEPEYSDVSPDRGDEFPMMLPPKTKTPEKPTLYPKLPTKEPSPKPQVLSKTGVVTTSYVKESNINKTYAAPEDDIDSTEEDILEPVKKTLSNPPVYTSSYVPLSESKVSTTGPLSATLSSSTRYSALGSSYVQNKPSTNFTTSNTRQSYEAPTRSSYQPRVTKQYVTDTYNVEDDEDEEDEDEEDEVVLVEDSPVGKDIQTPFLSQFARNLETLKATPIRHSVGPTRITPPKLSGSALRNREAAYTRRTVAGTGHIAPRRSYKPEQDESPFRQFVMALEEKYHLKQTFIIISIFIMAIFIYVFFIQSV